MEQEPRQINFAFIGFGHVGRAFARLLIDRRKWLLKEFGLEWKITGIATRNHGTSIDHNGLPIKKILGSWKRHSNLDHFNNGPTCDSTTDFIRQCGADVLFEMSVLNLSGNRLPPTCEKSSGRSSCHYDKQKTGRNPFPPIDGTRPASWRRLPVRRNRHGRSAVFNLVRQTLPATRIRSLRGILNSTTNYILTQMEQGTSFDSALDYARNAGLAEAEPGLEPDGLDAAAKLSVWIPAMMGGRVKPKDIERSGVYRRKPEESRGQRCAATAGFGWSREHTDKGAGSSEKLNCRNSKSSDPLAAIRTCGQYFNPEHGHHARVGNSRK